MRVLVVGGSGFLGREVCRRGVDAGLSVVGTCHSGTVGVLGVAARRLDVTDRAAVRALVAEVRPDAVVATPYRYDDWTVTADGAAHVALAAAEVGARPGHPVQRRTALPDRRHRPGRRRAGVGRLGVRRSAERGRSGRGQPG